MSAVGDFLAWPWSIVVSLSSSDGAGVFQYSKPMLTSTIRDKEAFLYSHHMSHKDSPLVPLILLSE